MPMRSSLLAISAMAWLFMSIGAFAAELEVTSYQAGTIMPDVTDQKALDRQLLDFYADWKAVYLKQGCGDGRAYVATSGDGKPTWGGSAGRSITVSEAHGYGMLITVMLADADPEAKDLFDGLVRFFLDHPAESDPGLMAWNQVEGCADAGDDVGGRNSATDGDLDIGYALLLADRKWGSTGEFDYLALARRTIDAVLAHEVAAGNFIQIGDWVNDVDDGTYVNTTRSSDFMQSHFNAFAKATSDARWQDLRDTTYDIMFTLIAQQSPATGLMPDFIIGLPEHPMPAPSGFLEGEFDGSYSWNAARYPWRVALDYLLYGDMRAYEALVPLNAWIWDTTGGDPHKVASTYLLDGTARPDQGEDDMVFVSMFAVSAMIDASNQSWLNDIWLDMVERNVQDEDYFGNTLKLLSMIAVSGHWAAY